MQSEDATQATIDLVSNWNLANSHTPYTAYVSKQGVYHVTFRFHLARLWVEMAVENRTAEFYPELLNN